MRGEIARLTEPNASNAVNGTTTPECAGVQIAKTVQRRKEKNPVTETTRKKMGHDTQDRRQSINTAIDEFDTCTTKIHKRDQRTNTAVQKAIRSTKTSRELYST